MQKVKDFLNRLNPNTKKRREYRLKRQKESLIQAVKENFEINLFCPNDYVEIIKEVYCDEIYNLQNYVTLNEHIVIDMGMNRGYASLYFAKNPLCKKVYGFEPCKETFETALKNFGINPDLKSKIIANNFGLSDKTEEKTIYSLDGKDWVATTNEEYFKKYSEETKSKQSIISLKPVSETITQILNENSGDEIILKIDVEGAEYEIIPALFSTNLLKKVNLIIGELHVVEDKQGTRNLFDYFYKSGFKPILLEEREKTIGFLFKKEMF